MMYDYSYWRSRPTEKDFSLDIISRHPEFDGRKLRKFALDGIETIGVWGDEPFEINFTNSSYEDVQVRISLDGTDVMTGKPADLEINHSMWLVRAGRTLHLRAWHESHEGGARFVFTSAEKSVALHAHGDMSHKGIISVAVFTEGEKPHRTWGMRTNSLRRSATKGIGTSVAGIGGAPASSYNSSYNYSELGEDPAAIESNSLSFDGSASLRKEAAVGAGEFVSQRTKTVQGLNKPVLNSILRVRYMWRDDVVARLKESKYYDPYPTGFPAEKIKTFADLSNVPRIESAAASRTVGIYSTSSLHTKSEPEPIFDRLM